MTSTKKFSLLRNILRAIGLSSDKVDTVAEWVFDLSSSSEVHYIDTEDKSLVRRELPYRLRDDFLSNAELSFYRVLKFIIQERGIILTKVGLSDIFYVRDNDPSQNRIYLNKIDRKHVDFLICNPETLIPVLGIELDDKSHKRADREERDVFVNELFKVANLPLLRIPVSRSYITKILDELISPYLMEMPDIRPQTSNTNLELVISDENEKSAPACPKCGSEMILRKAKQGKNQGEQFWGCSNYPKCRSMIKIRV